MPALPINDANLSDEEKARLHCLDLVKNQEGTQLDQVPQWLEDQDELGILRATENLKNCLFLKIIKGGATELDVLRYNVLKTHHHD